MNHCYIFDYGNCKIYHTEIPAEVEDIYAYIVDKLNTKEIYISTMYSDKELEIEEF